LFNCAEPEAITLALAKIAADTELRQRLQDEHVLLGAYANRLTQVNPNWTLAESQAPQPFRHDLTAQQYWHDYLPLWMDQLGVQLVGGCCGMAPEHIAYIRAQLDQRKQQT
jgi:S-methylmethionine-dependent homocysteine/selenocysteine methylase